MNVSDPPTPSNNLEELSDNLHSALDSLPLNGPYEYILDVIWLTDTVPSSRKIPPCLYGSLKRAVDWHDASVFLLSSKLDSKSFPNYLKDLRAELLSNHPICLQEALDPTVLWRGSLGFFEEASMDFVSMGKFELCHKSEASLHDLRPCDDLFSQRLKIVSKCALSTIPSYFLTNAQYILRTTLLNDDDEACDEFFNDPNLFGTDNCVIAKLERYESKGQLFRAKKSNPRSTDSWKKSVLDGKTQLEPDQEFHGKSLQTTFLAIFSKPGDAHCQFEERNCIEKHCLVLDPNSPLANYAKSFDVVTETEAVATANEHQLTSEVKAMDSFPSLDALKEFVDCAVVEIKKQMKDRHPDKKFDEATLEQDSLAVIAKFLHGTFDLNEIATPPIDCFDCQNLPFNGYEVFPRDDRRFLSFIQHCKNHREETKKSHNQTMMAPSGGNFVVLEAKEMLEHFTENGLPNLQKDLTILKPPLHGCRHIAENISEQDLKANQNWPDMLLTEYHDVYYNRTENSEKNDANIAKIQQMYVGSRETASTCHLFNSQETNVHTTSSASAKGDHVEPVPTPQQPPPKRSAEKPDVKTDPQLIFK